MDIVRATNQDILCIMNIISHCIIKMEQNRNYQWNSNYPNVAIIENDVNSEFGYIVKNKDKCIAYVAINEEQPIEYSQIIWSTDNSNVLVVHRLCIHPEFQRKGLSKKIMKFIEDYALENNYKCIRLDTYSDNEIALRLYENIGYKKLGQVFLPERELPFYCFDKILDI